VKEDANKMDPCADSRQEKTPKHSPLMLTAGFALLTLHIACSLYDYLLFKDLLTGPEIYCDFVLLGLYLPLLHLADIKLKHRWETYLLIALCSLLVGIFILEMVQIVHPFPEAFFSVVFNAGIVVTIATVILTIAISVSHSMRHPR